MTAPHAPDTGPIARLLGAFGITGVFWYRLHCWAVRSMPEPAVRAAVLAFSSAFFVLLPRIRRALAANLDPVLGPCGWLERQRRAYRTMRAFAWCLTERYERLATDVPFDVEPEGLDRWREVASGGGFVMVTGHVGNWELGSAIPADVEARTVHVVREEELDPRAQEFVRGLLARMGPRYETHFAGADPTLAVRLREALDRGEIVALQADRPRRGGRAIETRLFGRPFLLPAGPLALARAAGVPVLPVFVLRRGRRRYVLAVGEPIRDVHPEAGTRAVASALEAAIRRSPHQWFCFRALWPVAQRGERTGEHGLAVEADLGFEHPEAPRASRGTDRHDERRARG
jgi:KDO2-lipid IV(A) lauroyltransferase